MHDPSTMAFEIKYPWKERPPNVWSNGYRHTFITIWHEDPCKDGTDDSCGWFKRARHGDKEVLAKIIKEFDFEWQYWFNEDGDPKLSVIATVLDMFKRALQVHYGFNWNKTDKFIKNNLSQIIMFAENATDSMYPSITQLYGKGEKEDRIEEIANIIYGWILRTEQKWYQHTKWHVWHWRLQIHPWQSFKRRYFDRCYFCKKRFAKGESVYGNWNGDMIFHNGCDGSMVKVKENKTYDRI